MNTNNFFCRLPHTIFAHLFIFIIITIAYNIPAFCGAIHDDAKPDQPAKMRSAAASKSDGPPPLDMVSTLTDLSNRVFTIKDFSGFGLGAVALREQKEFTFKILVASELPIYAIHVAASVADSQGHIDVYRHAATGTPLQVIKLNPKAFFANSVPFFFNVADINFDGYVDIGVLIDGGALWGAYQYWVYDKHTGTFAQAPVTDDFKAVSFGYSLTFDTIKKQVIATGAIGAIGGYRDTYQFGNGRLLPLVEIEEMNVVVLDTNANTGHPTIHCVIETKHHNGSKTTTTTQILNKACGDF